MTINEVHIDKKGINEWMNRSMDNEWINESINKLQN